MARLKRPIKPAGFSLVEVILAIALFSLFATALVGLLLSSYGSDVQAAQKDKATLYAQEGLEAVFSIRRQAWNLLANGDHGLSQTNGYWEFFGSADNLEGQYDRVITIADACHDSGGMIVDCSAPGAIFDLHTRKASVNVTYTAITRMTNQVNLEAYLTTWQTKDWVQTDWSGGSGQSLWSNLARYSNDDGKVDVSTSGEVKLRQLVAGCGTKTWPFDLATNYVFDPSKIEVTGGVAQLVGPGGGTHSWTFDLAGDYIYDSAKIQVVSGVAELVGTVVCTGTATACGSLTSQTTCQAQSGCSWLAGGSCGNVGSCGAASKNLCNPCIAAGCAKQGQSCLGDLNCPAITDPTVCNTCGQCSWTGGVSSCTGTASACGSLTSQTICQAQSGCSWIGNFPTDSPPIKPTTTFTPAAISSWSAFTETATKNGGEIYYKLYDGSSWYWYNGGWTITDETSVSNANSAVVINANIASFPLAGGQIMFKAFLVSNGNQQVQLDQIDIGWSEGSGAGSCTGTASACGSLTSQPICQAQSGCSWLAGSGSCNNVGSCGAAGKNLCNSCNTAGCSRQGQSCAGTLNCPAITDPTICNTCGQCNWAGGVSSCTGTASACSSFTDFTFCQAQSGCSWAGGGFPTDQPPINPTASFDVSLFYFSWSNFKETATKNGGEIYYQLSPNDGSSWYYWNGSSWALAGATNYNPAGVVNNYIGQFTTSTAKIMFKAFLASDGNQQVILDEVQVSCNKEHEWPFTDSADYLFDPSKIEVTGGAAQLVGTAGSCTGTASACGSLTSQPICQAQSGCSWLAGSGSCNNVGSCGAAVKNLCNSCIAAGCAKQGQSCLGDLNCPAITDPTVCNTCGQCLWTGSGGSCNGTATGCSSLTDQTSCQTQGGCSWSGSFPADRPPINPVVSFSAPGIDRWQTFKEIATKNGGEIYYQLSSNDGIDWYYWNGSQWVLAGATNYNPASVIDTNIDQFPTVSGKIMFKAFLASDGSQQVTLASVKVGWGEVGGAGGYETFGSLESSALDMTTAAAVDILDWEQVIPSCSPACEVKFQVRTAPDTGGAPGSWTAWSGATGSGTYFTDSAGTILSTDLNFNQWAQYRLELIGDGNDTPIVQEVKFNYLP